MNSEQIDQIATALAAAQMEIEDPHKTRTGKIKGETKAGKYYEYEYKYADIADVLKQVRGALSKHGIAVSQPTIMDGTALIVRSRLLHSSGQWLESDYPVCSLQGDHQKMGAAMTYARRYALTSLVGVAADEDTDGQGAAEADSPKSGNGNHVRQPRKQADISGAKTTREQFHDSLLADMAQISSIVAFETWERDVWTPAKGKLTDGHRATLEQRVEDRREELSVPVDDEPDEPAMAAPDPDLIAMNKLKSVLSACQDEPELDRIKASDLFVKQFKTLPTAMQAQVMAHGATIRSRFHPKRRGEVVVDKSGREALV